MRLIKNSNWPWYLEFHLRLRTYVSHLSASSYSRLRCIFSACRCTAFALTNNYTVSGKARYQEHLEKKLEGEIQKRGQKGWFKGSISHSFFFSPLCASPYSHVLFPCLHFKDDEWHSDGRLLISSVLGRGLDRDCTVFQRYRGGCATPSINYICLEYHLQGAHSWTTHGLREQ